MIFAGLFKSAIVIHDARFGKKKNDLASNESMMLNYDQLVELSLQFERESHMFENDLQVRLTQTLSQANQVLETSNAPSATNQPVHASDNSPEASWQSNSNNIQDKNIFDLIQASNVSQLARLDGQFKLLASQKLVALVEQPTLADPLLFPNFLFLIQSNGFGFKLQKQAQLNYCLYLKSLQFVNQNTPNTNNSMQKRLQVNADFLGLLGGLFHWTNNNGMNLVANQTDQELVTESSSGSKKTTNNIEQQADLATRAQIPFAFRNLFNLNMLNSILSGEWSLAKARLNDIDQDDATTGTSGTSNSVMNIADDLDSDVFEQHQRTTQTHKMAPKVKLQHNSNQLANDKSTKLKARQTLESLGQVNIMFGLIIGNDNNLLNYENDRETQQNQMELSNSFMGEHFLQYYKSVSCDVDAKFKAK